MKQSLPARPSLEHLKSQAKDLLAAAKSGDSSALARFTAALPRVPSSLALHDAQSVIAREHGFESWRALRSHVVSAPALRELFARHIEVPLPREIIEAAASMGFAPRESLAVSPELPLLALRNALLAPGAVAPLDVVRPATFLAIEEAERADGLLAVFAQRDPETTDLHVSDLHPIGCVARIVKASPKAEGKWLLVHGLAWIELESLEGHRVGVVPFDVEEDAEGRVDELRARVERAVRQLPDSASIRERVSRMTPLELADAAVVNATCGVEAKAEYAAERRLSARIERAIAIVGG